MLDQEGRQLAIELGRGGQPPPHHAAVGPEAFTRDEPRQVGSLRPQRLDVVAEIVAGYGPGRESTAGRKSPSRRDADP